MPSSRFSATDLHQLERQLKAWRRLRRGHGRLPEGLWEAAVGLGRTHGLSRVARRLHLDYYKLKRLSSDRGSASPAKKASDCRPAFVEMALPAPSPEAAVCRVELRNGQGGTMRVDLPNDSGAVLKLVETFWRRT